jgi:hypothetical protein
MDICEVMHKMRGLDPSQKTKLVRHMDKRFDVWQLYRDGLLETYQAYQANPIFHECRYLVVFLGDSYNRAVFTNVYEVVNHRPANTAPLPADTPFGDFDGIYHHFYELTPLTGFEDLRERLVIDWGLGTLSWHQWMRPKDVVEILPPGYVTGFPGYLEVDITYRELRRIISNEAANREWHRLLAAVAGVYLIVDDKTGMQYVGSAYGDKGILGRWRSYAKQPHGGNVRLKALLDEEGADYAQNFRFSILHTLPRTDTREQVLAWETRMKKKLGSRAFGLNRN